MTKSNSSDDSAVEFSNFEKIIDQIWARWKNTVSLNDLLSNILKPLTVSPISPSATYEKKMKLTSWNPIAPATDYNEQMGFALAIDTDSSSDKNVSFSCICNIPGNYPNSPPQFRIIDENSGDFRLPNCIKV